MSDEIKSSMFGRRSRNRNTKPPNKPIARSPGPVVATGPIATPPIQRTSVPNANGSQQEQLDPIDLALRYLNKFQRALHEFYEKAFPQTSTTQTSTTGQIHDEIHTIKRILENAKSAVQSGDIGKLKSAITNLKAKMQQSGRSEHAIYRATQTSFLATFANLMYKLANEVGAKSLT